jgi:hypothetical protein
VDERPGGLLYRCGGVDFALFQSAGESPGTFTQMGWEVDDIEAVVSELKRRGVVFEEVDLPGLRTREGTGSAKRGSGARSLPSTGCRAPGA